MSTTEILKALEGKRRGEYTDVEGLIEAISEAGPYTILQCLELAHDNGIMEASNSIRSMAGDMRTRAASRVETLHFASKNRADGNR